MHLITPHQIPGVHEPEAATGLTKAEEVILTFPDQVPAGTAINIQDGTYTGGGPASVEGTSTLSLPATFDTNALIQVLLNGSEQYKGSTKDVYRSSATQITFNDKVKKDNIVKVRIFS